MVEQYEHFEGPDFVRWFRNSLPSLGATATSRHTNGIILRELLPFFVNDPSLWKESGALNAWDGREDASFESYLASWDACLRSRGFPGRLPDLFRNRLGLPAVGFRRAALALP